MTAHVLMIIAALRCTKRNDNRTVSAANIKQATQDQSYEGVAALTRGLHETCKAPL
jgi:hypothetical protein